MDSIFLIINTLSYIPYVNDYRVVKFCTLVIIWVTNKNPIDIDNNVDATHTAYKAVFCYIFKLLITFYPVKASITIEIAIIEHPKVA